MPIYEYRCQACGASFEQRRPASESASTAVCPEGHPGARRRLSVFATASRSAPAATSAPAGGGCGAGCACAAAAAH
jgi:putative FmdB family regulatory protein